MKINYFFKHLFVWGGLLCVTSLSAQIEPKVPNLVQLESPVVVSEDEVEEFVFAYQSHATWGDFNNDGYLDLVIAGITHDGYTTRLYQNNGDGTFTSVEHPFPDMMAGAIVWLDYDNDGYLDIFLVGRVKGTEPNEEGNLPDERVAVMYRNLGASENYGFEEVFHNLFEPMDNENSNKSTRFVAVADFNNDGWIDIFMTGWGEEGRTAILYRNQYGGDFLKVYTPVVGNKPLIQMNGGAVAWGDYNNDGYFDLFVSGYANAGSEANIDYGDEVSDSFSALYTNNGDGTFGEPIFLVGGDEGDVAFADFNSDGKLDIIVTGYSHKEIDGNRWLSDIYVNEGEGSFDWLRAEGIGLPATQQNTVASGDLNNDGYEDIVMLNMNPLVMFLNNQDMTFTQQDLSFVDGNEFNIRSGIPCLIDYDNDGNLDLFVSGYIDQDGIDGSFLFQNELGDGIEPNQAPTAPTNLAFERQGNTVTFTWDASTDDFTPTDALRYNLFVKEGDDVIKMVLPSDLETGRLKVNDNLAALTTTFYTMANVSENFTWGVQAIDNAKATSKFTVYAEDGIYSETIFASVKVIAVDGGITVKADNNLTGKVDVYSISGMNISATKGQLNDTKIDLNAGSYIVKVTSQEGTSVYKVIVK